MSVEPLRPSVIKAEHPQRVLPPTVMTICGVSALVHHCEIGFVGTVGEVGEDGIEPTGRIAVTLIDRPLPGMPYGFGLLLTPPPDAARALGQQLLDMADRAEAMAAQSAADLLGRVTAPRP